MPSSNIPLNSHLPRPTRSGRRQQVRRHRRARRGLLLIAAASATILAVFSGSVGNAAETYRLRCADQPYSFQQSTAPNGAVIRHHELRAGDIAALDAKYGDGRQRCEMIGQTDFPFRTPIWFSYSFRQTGSMPNSWVTMTQFHTSPEAGERSGKPPAFLMQQSHGRLELLTRSDTRVHTTTQVAPVVRYSMPWFPSGTWQNIVVRLTFDPFGQGNVTFWLNGVKKYSSGPIRMGYNDSVGPHFAQGQYRGKSDKTTTLEFADVEVGRTSLAARITTPKHRF